MKTKLFAFTAALVLPFVLSAVTPDLTSSLEFLGNPMMERWPGTPNARGILDLQFYRGRLFNGAGETESNPGATWIYSLDPADNEFKFEFNAGSEAIGRFRIASWGDLVTSAQDPHEGDENVGHFFTRNAEGKWSVFSSVVGSTKEGTKSSMVINSTHCWDFAEYNNRIFVSCYNLLSSSDHLNTFTVLPPISNTYATVYSGYIYNKKLNYSTYTRLRRQMQLLPFENELFAVPNTTVFPHYMSDNGNINLAEVFRYDSSADTFVDIRQRTRTLLPDLTADDFELAIDNASLKANEIGSILVRLWHTTPFKGRVLYVGSVDSNGDYTNTSYPLPLMGCSATVSSHQIQATRISFGGDRLNFPWDFAVVGDTVYALTTKYNSTTKQNKHIVWKSTDGINFTEVLSFDFHQNFISLDYRDGWFYFGAGNKVATLGYSYDSQVNESGAIYRVRCPQEPVQVVASVDELTIPEGESRTVTFCLATAPATNMTFRVGATLENTRFTTDKSSLTFTTSNWSTPQSVVISVADDHELNVNRKGVVACGVAGYDVERGEFCGPEATAGVIRLQLGDSDLVPPGNGEIRTADDFYRAMEFPDGNYRLMNNIDLTDSKYVTIDEFSGSLDGNGYTLTGLGKGPFCKRLRGSISNLTLDGEGLVMRSVGQGVFCHDMANGAFTNVRLKGYTMKPGAPETFFGLFTAKITGRAEFVGCSVASDCVVSQASNIHHDSSFGSFVGKITCNTINGTIASFIDCTNNASVVAYDNYRAVNGAGGFVGIIIDCNSTSEPEIAFIRCVNNGNLTGNSANVFLGGFVGRHKGAESKSSSSVSRFEDCVNNGSITTVSGGKKGGAGGFIGALSSGSNGDFNRCFNRGDIAASTTKMAGGLVGSFGDYSSNLGVGGIRFRNCANYGDLTSYNMVGGLLGNANSNSGYANGKFHFLNCANYGNLVTGSDTNGQMFAMINCNATAAGVRIVSSNCWGRTSVFGYYSKKPAIEGANQDASVDNAVALAALNAVAESEDDYLSWVIGPTGYPELTLSAPSDDPVDPPSDPVDPPSDPVDPPVTPPVDPVTPSTPATYADDPNATTIMTAAEFQAMVNNPSADYRLGADIDLSTITYSAIPEFSGNLYGLGHVVHGFTSNLVVRLSGAIYDVMVRDVEFEAHKDSQGIAPSAGAFAVDLANALVAGCVVSNCTFKPKNNVSKYYGAIAAASVEGHNVISNCSAYGCTIGLLQGNVTGGGLVGDVEGSVLTVVDCKVANSGERDFLVRGGKGSGGVVGLLSGSSATSIVIRCSFNGTATAEGVGTAGGIIGYAAGANNCATLSKAEDCVNYGNIIGKCAGGIVGAAYKGGGIEVSRCANRGVIVCSASEVGSYNGAGGIVGGLYSVYAGERLFVDRCENYGYIASTNVYAGGIVGNYKKNNDDTSRFSSVSNSANYGSIVGGLGAGGIIGRCYYPKGDFCVNVYNSGSVLGRGAAPAGGVIGDMRSETGSNVSYMIADVCSVGNVTSESGDASACIGNFSLNCSSKRTYTLDVKSGIFAGVVTGNRTALICCGDGNSGAGALTFNVTVDDNCRFAGDIAGTAYYDVSGTAQTIGGLVALGSGDLTNGNALTILDGYAQANGLLRWTQGAASPVLQFSQPAPKKRRGLMIIVR